jgi:hypothetical protein
VVASIVGAGIGFHIRLCIYIAAAIFKAVSSLNFPKTSASILWKSSFLNVLELKRPFFPMKA